jgi:membrane-bound metal-dependent hydrolase YbcI (DUF457 family)
MAVSIPFIYHMPVEEALLSGGICYMSCNLPDIDVPSSYIAKTIPILPKYINKLFGHRKLFHSPFLLCLLDLLLYYVLKDHLTESALMACLLGFTYGFGIHLCLDIFTVGGIPIFYPIFNRNIHLTTRKTGESGENLIMMLVCCAVIGLSVWGIMKSGITEWLW